MQTQSLRRPCTDLKLILIADVTYTNWQQKCKWSIQINKQNENLTPKWPETQQFDRLESQTSSVCMCMNYPVCMFTCVDIVKHVKDTMRDNSCITQLGQSSSGAAGSSLRQMENVLVPLHAWTHSPPSAANTTRSLANLRHNFKGTWF